jgi:aminodeoxyfutalosine synthase
MTTSVLFDRYLERVTGGERLSADEIHELSTTPDILPLGMLADSVRRRMHDARATFVRVAIVAHDTLGESIPQAARELRVTGSPDRLSAAVEMIARARIVAGDRVLSALSWVDVDRFADGSATRLAEVLTSLRQAGLDAFAEFPLDRMRDLDIAVDAAAAAGFTRLRLTIDTLAAAERTALFLRAGQLEQRYSCIQAINPLPMTLATFRPTTGYEDVKTIALARLAAPDVSTIQVDWRRYGPKLAQVALTFGADDIDGISPSDEAPEGRRRAPLEEIRRNIDAAGYTPVERDGRFTVIA